MSKTISLAFARALQVRREQWLEPEDLERRQWTRFQRVLRHAFHESPFYAQRFREAGLTPDSIRDLGDLARIPVVTRADLRHPKELISSRWRPQAMKRSFSSGSTGESVETYFDPPGWFVGKHLLKMRARWACGVRPSDRVALFTASAFSNSLTRRLALRQQSYSVHRPAAELISELRQFSPTVLYGFPSHFRELAGHWSDDLRVRLVFTSGEMLDDHAREHIEESLGAPVFDVYGCTELKEIAWECPAREGYHVNDDWVLVESVGDEGAIVVTSLYNYGMPLIRYRLGDTGKFLRGVCSCGRGLRLMAPGFGRSVDYFRLSSGARVSPYTMINNMEVLVEIRQFQIVQKALDRVIVRVVPGDGFGAEAHEAIRGALVPHLHGVAIEILAVEEIRREEGGKYRMVISEVVPAEPAS